ncbi:SMC family ATPase [Candidatus Woesearchaeota archaeon]|nr:SMC family ATPase [Candidatus Woesearchaeota archaeon]
MLFLRLVLHNIRSYVDATINFPKGSVLLSGDVGSGKSTILLAVEFALFGINRGFISGSTILRNGASSGFVRLTFEISGKEICIERHLKRTSTSVSQDAGILTVDGVSKEYTALELRQRILDILSYPPDLLTKSKSLVYRYTIYTPQEEMKHILLGDKEVRLTTLRKVFGIDKYQRIKDNASIFLTSLRGRTRELSGQVSDLSQKKQQLDGLSSQLNSLKENLASVTKELGRIQNTLFSLLENYTSLEKQMQVLSSLQQQKALLEQEYTQLHKGLSTQMGELSAVASSLLQLREQHILPETSAEKLSSELFSLNEKIKLSEQALYEDRLSIHRFQTFKQSSEGFLSHISSLSSCPVCRQEVGLSHKKEVHAAESSKIISYLAGISKLEGKCKKNEEDLAAFRLQQENLRESEKQLQVALIYQQHIFEQEQREKQLQGQIFSLNEQLKTASLRQSEVSSKIDGLSDLQARIQSLKHEIDTLSLQEREFALKENTLSVEIRETGRSLLELQSEISRKEAISSLASRLSLIEQWVLQYFLSVLDVIERHVFSKVHRDFDVLFQKWFSILVAEEGFSVRLDSDFTPLIEQNSHDIDYTFLSGGEKTACALSYRLALNQVINNVLSTIKTNDVIILDEPTDGFSSEQLERVRYVLEELDLQQVILVSHEPKIESFVNNVIHLRKENHVSFVD